MVTVLVLVILVMATADAESAGAQEPMLDVDTTTVADSTASVSPGGAFARSLVVPGWGQAALESYVRGGVYFTANAGSWFMLLKTIAKLSEARDIERRRVAFVRDSVVEAGQTPSEEQIDAAPLVTDIRELISSREQQREDWIAWTIFWTFAGAADAFVTAHLADFPAEVSALPAARGGMQLQVTVPVGGGS